jgi:hypothetical protein
LLSQFYVNDEDSYCDSGLAESAHQVCIINDYEEAESVDSRSIASLDYGESLLSPASVDTCATSVASRRSGLSLQCQGQTDVDNKAALLEWKTHKWSSSMSCEYVGNDEETESNADEDQQTETGLVYGRSWWSTPATFHEGFNVSLQVPRPLVSCNRNPRC